MDGVGGHAQAGVVLGAGRVIDHIFRESGLEFLLGKAALDRPPGPGKHHFRDHLESSLHAALNGEMSPEKLERVIARHEDGEVLMRALELEVDEYEDPEYLAGALGHLHDSLSRTGGRGGGSGLEDRTRIPSARGASMRSPGRGPTRISSLWRRSRRPRLR